MVDIEVNNRFIKIAEYLGFTKKGKLTKSALADYIGVSPSTIGEICELNNGVGVGVLIGLGKRNPEINTTWILTGEGSMIIGEEKTLSERRNDQVKLNEKCQECERNKGRIEILRETIAELKKENSELINLLAKYRAKE